jgi:hypothetical protein
MSIMRSVRIMSSWLWLLIPAAVLMLAVVTRGQDLRAQSPEPAINRADPATFKAGTLNQNAASELKAFGDFPVLWLGEDFEGYKLTSVQRTNSVTPAIGPLPERRDNRISLVYGACVVEPGDWGCTPPLSIIIWAPNTIPGSGGIEKEAIQAEGSARGLVSAVVSESTILWAQDGIAIQIHANGEMQERIVKGLRLANASTIGVADLGPNTNLAGLNGVRGPVGTAIPTPENRTSPTPSSTSTSSP